MSKAVLVTGGRFFNLSNEVHRALIAIHGKYGISCIHQGGATGADELAKLWAGSQNIDVRTHEANWMLYGNRAGNIRNSAMLRAAKPDMGVAFPGGDGTRDMVEKLREAKVPIMIGTYTAGTDDREVSWRMLDV